MKPKRIPTLIALAGLALAASGKAAVVHYFWEESGGDVVLAVTGSLDVAGWSTSSLSGIDQSQATSSNDHHPPMPAFQSLNLYGETTPGEAWVEVAYLEGGTLDLSPWGDDFANRSFTGSLEFGGIAGLISINRYYDTKVNIYLQQNAIVDDSYTVSAAYRFAGTTLEEMFSGGQTEWGGGARIATFGNNEVRFQIVPEPSVSAFFAGFAALSLVCRRRQ